MSVRAEIAELLRAEVPATWRVITTEEGVDKISTTLVRLKQQSIIRHPAAPLGKHLVEFICQIAVPGQDFGKAEDQLDADVQILLFALSNLGGAVHWERAEKVQLAAGNLAYDITLTVTTDKPVDPNEPPAPEE